MEPDVQRELDRLDKRLMAVETVPMKVATLEVEMNGLTGDVAEVRESLSKLHSEWSESRKKDETRREEERRERQSNFHWLVGVVLSSAAIIVASLGLLL